MDVGTEELEARRGIGNRSVTVRAAKLFSVVLHPFLLPVIGIATLLYGPTYLFILPNTLKLYIVGVVALTTLFFPALTVALLHNLGILQSLSLNSRRERTLPLVIVAVGYAVCYFLLARYIAIGLIPEMLRGALGIILLCFGINLFWKISLHMAAIGGLTAMLMDITVKGYGLMTAFFILFLILSGTLGTARLSLGKHNGWQILAGFLTGGIVMFLSLNLT